ncbi:MAG: hypothetical protein ACI9N3_000013 [Colwellia sp.]
MKKLILILLTLSVSSGCTSTQSADSTRCIHVVNAAEKHRVKPGDDLYKGCIEKEYQKKESEKGFWGKSAENLVLLVIDIVSS